MPLILLMGVALVTKRVMNYCQRKSCISVAHSTVKGTTPLEHDRVLHYKSGCSLQEQRRLVSSDTAIISPLTSDAYEAMYSMPLIHHFANQFASLLIKSFLPIKGTCSFHFLSSSFPFSLHTFLWACTNPGTPSVHLLACVITHLILHGF